VVENKWPFDSNASFLKKADFKVFDITQQQNERIERKQREIT
jgi:hypothetical protein